jgi:hypothetical protein
MDYATLRARMQRHPVMTAEVPTGHTVSLPLPTLRCGAPGLAAFAAPADRSGGALRQGPPDRWWVIDAATTRLVVYALTRAAPLLPDAPGPLAAIPPLALSMATFKLRVDALDAILDVAAAQFWRGEVTQDGAAIAAAITDVVVAPLLPAYRSLTPDFFEWLET